jgi:hypothetical protein
MKIGLIGNMNNNNFAILRYLRDLGADAHLLLFTNDGAASLGHFTPDSDTWNIEQWQAYIHQTDIPNSSYSALDPSITSLILKRASLQGVSEGLLSLLRPVTRSMIRKAYGGYPHLIGSGIAPALCHRAGLKLSIFYPYSIGVEYLDSPEFLEEARRGSFVRRQLWNLVKRRQRKGIIETRHVLNAETGPTESALNGIGVSSTRLALPLYYNREVPPEKPAHPLLSEALARITCAHLAVLSSSRLCWQQPPSYTDDEWRYLNKNNHWLLHAFRGLCQARPGLNPLLILIEYGPDVDLAKRLCHELGIEQHVLWLPKMSRKELAWLLARVDVAVGEFYDAPSLLWGGTGWEALACGKPLLQGFNFQPGEFSSKFGHPPPPMMPVQSEDDILPHLLAAADDRQALALMGRDAKEWFDQHNGLELARRWLETLQH